jgi:hypothetical protein
MGKMQHIFGLLLAIILLSNSCSKNKKIRTALDLTQITERDINAQMLPMGTIDSTDWLLNETFTLSEDALFSLGKNGSICNVGSSDYILVNPNASNGIFFLSNNFTTIINSEFIFVDKNLNIIKSYTSLTNLTNQIFDLQNVTSNGDYIRVYYRLTTTNCTYQGHGDIKIKK